MPKAGVVSGLITIMNLRWWRSLRTTPFTPGDRSSLLSQQRCPFSSSSHLPSSHSRQGIWDVPLIHEASLEFIAFQRPVKRFYDLYSLSVADFKWDGTTHLIHRHSGSVRDGLVSVYVKLFRFNSWRFNKAPAGLAEEEDVRDHLDEVARSLNVRLYEDFYQVELRQLNSDLKQCTSPTI